MENLTSYNLLFFIKKKKLLDDGLASLFLRITINKKRKEFVLKCKINPKKWNSKLGMAEGNSKESKLANEFINSVKFRIQTIINNLNIEGKEITSEEIANKYIGRVPKIVRILELFNDHNKKVRSLEGIDYASETCLRYETCFRHIQAFIKKDYKRNDLELDELDHNFISGLEFYIKTEVGCNHNTTKKYLKNFKKITRIALNSNKMKLDPFANYKLTLKKVDRDFLTDEEIQKLFKKKFEITRLEQVKDCFLFPCFTGLAYSDLKNLTSQKI